MITIFYDFRHFSAKKLSFFFLTNVTINVSHQLAVFRTKKRKIITSVPVPEKDAMSTAPRRQDNFPILLLSSTTLLTGMDWAEKILET
jgi:hypothetical protein